MNADTDSGSASIAARMRTIAHRSGRRRCKPMPPRNGGFRNANEWLLALYGCPSEGPSDLVLDRLVGGTQHYRSDPPERLLSLEVKLGVRQQGLVSIGEFRQLLAGIRRQDLGPFYGGGEPFQVRHVLARFVAGIQRSHAADRGSKRNSDHDLSDTGRHNPLHQRLRWRQARSAAAIRM